MKNKSISRWWWKGGKFNKVGCDRWAEKMVEKPEMEMRRVVGGELVSTVSVSGWQDLRVVFQARILTWGVGKAETPRRVPNMRHAERRKWVETLLS